MAGHPPAARADALEHVPVRVRQGKGHGVARGVQDRRKGGLFAPVMPGPAPALRDRGQIPARGSRGHGLLDLLMDQKEEVILLIQPAPFRPAPGQLAVHPADGQDELDQVVLAVVPHAHQVVEAAQEAAKDGPLQGIEPGFHFLGGGQPNGPLLLQGAHRVEVRARPQVTGHLFHHQIGALPPAGMQPLGLHGAPVPVTF